MLGLLTTLFAVANTILLFAKKFKVLVPALAIEYLMFKHITKEAK